MKNPPLLLLRILLFLLFCRIPLYAYPTGKLKPIDHLKKRDPMITRPENTSDLRTISVIENNQEARNTDEKQNTRDSNALVGHFDGISVENLSPEGTQKEHSPLPNVSLPFTFSGTQEEAKRDVKELRNSLLYIQASNPSWIRKNFILHPGPTQKKEEWTFSLHTQQESLNISAEDKEQTQSYIKNLLETAYPSEHSLEMEMTHQGFVSYLNPGPSHLKDLSAEELLEQIQQLHLIQVEQQALEQAQEKSPLLFSHLEPEKITETLSDFLKSKKVEIGEFKKNSRDRVGEGSFGIVVTAKVDGDSSKYVYKQGKKKVSQSLKAQNPFFWREGDLAATTLRISEGLVKPLFFIFRICQNNETDQLHFVPANHVKAFGMKLPLKSSVFLEGELMERASGNDLEKIITNNRSKIHITERHFLNVVSGLFKVIQNLQIHNFVYRDLKPENIFYDFKTGKVTLIDFGLATRLRKKEKMDHEAHLHLITSTRYAGSPDYISPRVLKKEPYGSEIDFFSYAMVLLRLIDPNEFFQIGDERFKDITSDKMLQKAIATQTLRDQLFYNKTPAEYLTSCLNVLGRGSKIAMSLEKYPSLKTLIDLSFRASAGGKEGQDAYQELKNSPYFQTPLHPL